MLLNKAFPLKIPDLPDFPDLQLHVINTIRNLIELKLVHIQFADSELIGVIVRVVRLENERQLSTISFVNDLRIETIII